MSSAGGPHPSAEPVPAAVSFQNLTRRVRTALVLAVAALAAILATPEWPIYLLAATVSYFAALEADEVLGGKRPVLALIAMGASLAVVWVASRFVPAPFAALAVVLVGTAGLAMRIQRGSPGILDGLAFGWIAGPVACALWLHNATADSTRLFSPNLLAVVALPLWLGDTAAYFMGKKFGKRLIAPKISPNKTVVGSLANLVVSVLSSVAVGLILNRHLVIPLSAPTLVTVGLAVGILGQVGDLLESALKRSAGVKDSGNLLPGHGGILDRIDSFLFASVPACLILWLMARASFT